MTVEWPDAYAADVVAEGFGRLSSFTIALEAWRRGLTVTFFDGIQRRYEVVDDAGRSVTFNRSRPHMTKPSAVDIANDKHATIEHLRRANIPTPPSVPIRVRETTVDEVKRLADDFGYPVVLKPTKGAHGHGVFSGITSAAELEEYYAHLVHELGTEEILLEKHVKGKDYRVLVIGGAIGGVCLRQPANVVGDGERSVKELIRSKNDIRRKNPFLYGGLIRRDSEVDNFLAHQGLTIDSTPVEGAIVQLRAKANGSAGADIVGMTDGFPVEIKQAAINAVAAIPDLFLAGVDILYDETTRGHQFHILELNATPQIGVNMYPTHGVGSDVPSVMLDQCFPESRRSGSLSEQLVYPRAEVLHPLRTGVAEAVRLTPLPSHRFPCRRIYRFSRGRSLTERQESRLLKASRRRGIAGHWMTGESHDALLAAGADEQAVEAFVRSASRIVESRPETFEPWAGAVQVGFRVLPQG